MLSFLFLSLFLDYNFTENPEHLKLNKDHIEEVEKQIENSTPSAFSLSKGAFIFTQSPPNKKDGISRLFYLSSSRFNLSVRSPLTDFPDGQSPAR